MYGADAWALTSTDEELLGLFERKVLRIIFCSIYINEVWRTRYNFELYQLYGGKNIVSVIKTQRLRWLGHVYRMDDNLPARRVLFNKPVGARRRGRPRIRWMQDVEADLVSQGIRNWKMKAADRDTWKETLRQA